MNRKESLDFYSFVQTVHDEGESTQANLELNSSLNGEKLEQMLLRGVEDEYFLVEKDSNPRKYSLNYDKLVEVWEDIWRDKLGEMPPIPANFDNFLENYIKSYLDEEEYSSLEEMLYEKFYLGLSKVSSGRGLTNDYVELVDTLSDGFEDKKRPAEHVMEGLDNQ
jgi:hypothetical protein